MGLQISKETEDEEEESCACAYAVVSNMEEKERRADKPSCKGAESREAAPVTSAGTTSASEHESDPNWEAKLDVCSESFDPLLALYSPTVHLPHPNIKCFNNVAQYESFLKGGRGRAKPENVEKRQREALKGVVDPKRIERLKKLMVRNVSQEAEEGEPSGVSRRRKQKTHKNVLTRMPLCKGSPLGELHRCVEERIRVKVHIRTFKGLRGVCSGFVVAFDKFWNMAMVDVDETYREPLLGEAYYHEKALTVSQLFEKLKLQDSPESGEQARTHKPKGKTSVPQLTTTTSLSPHPPPVSKKRDNKDKNRDSRTDPSLSRNAAGVQEVEHRDFLKSYGSKSGQEAQKKSSHPYGKVHIRHINQLFIRGENVLLVNIQSL
ncbi:U7 snRNA-associated Sm-like protein LSm11 [Lampris incognitus]|uniref:U7 snRNA-associated Sm-like protein LSm11 n=1 Tax=Lampris incognitus TaxID=2546036 RepID=UPI0024B48C92|nr:U7 snRNA-associated Sm-like protein LSm11 [Lampris incognitus]